MASMGGGGGGGGGNGNNNNNSSSSSSSSSASRSYLTPGMSPAAFNNGGDDGALMGGGGSSSSSSSSELNSFPFLLFERAERRLANYPVIVRTSAYCGMRPIVFVGLLVSGLFVSLGFGWGGGLICNLAGFLYPAWMSFKAIESPSKSEAVVLLMYWVVYAAFSVIEYFVDIILFWLPFYYLLKLTFLMYLYLPWFRGAEVIYKSFVRPYLLTHQHKIDDAVDSLGAVGAAAADGVSNVVSDGIGLVTQAAGAVRRGAAASRLD